MPRYRLTLAYDGTDFCGWQKQEPPIEAGAHARAYGDDTPRIDSARPDRVALRTVQGVVERAVRDVVRQDVELIGASRTDSGVHALGQVAAFTCGPGIDPAILPEPPGSGWPVERGADRLAAALNSRLPDDVLVRAAALAPDDFDPVGGARAKGYAYTFWVSPARPLWSRRRVHHLWHPRGLDADAMNAAAAVLVGEHDFAAFAAAGHGRLSTVRTVFECRVESSAPPADDAPGGQPARLVTIRVSGNGFLWNMVRIIAGSLMQVGLGQRSADDLRRALESRDRAQAGPTAPARGLCLEWINYD
ncbi:MAG: tRNA pseudouridine synthase A [Phycisphaeraceae bacterium]|nr:tRNA pseudouridine synthase A [Phycisphaeraceae bacterium]